MDLIKKVFYKYSNFRRGINVHENIIIFSDPRSGSTWLSESLKCITNKVIVDEPLHLKILSQKGINDFYWRQHIPIGETLIDFENYIMNILEGKDISYNLLTLNSIKEIKKAESLIVKIIRGKLLLPWFLENFKLERPPIFLIRNPYSAIASAISHSAWHYNFETFNMPKNSFNDVYKDHIDLLNSFTHKEEELIFHWCLGNSVCLKSESVINFCALVKYEDLLNRPIDTASYLQEKLKLNIPQSEFLNYLKIPSSTRTKKGEINSYNQKNDFKKLLSKDQMNRINNVLNYFDFEYENLESSY